MIGGVSRPAPRLGVFGIQVVGRAMAQAGPSAVHVLAALYADSPNRPLLAPGREADVVAWGVASEQHFLAAGVDFYPDEIEPAMQALLAAPQEVAQDGPGGRA